MYKVTYVLSGLKETVFTELGGRAPARYIVISEYIIKKIPDLFGYNDQYSDSAEIIFRILEPYADNNHFSQIVDECEMFIRQFFVSLYKQDYNIAGHSFYFSGSALKNTASITINNRLRKSGKVLNEGALDNVYNSPIPNTNDLFITNAICLEDEAFRFCTLYECLRFKWNCLNSMKEVYNKIIQEGYDKKYQIDCNNPNINPQNSFNPQDDFSYLRTILAHHNPFINAIIGVDIQERIKRDSIKIVKIIRDEP